MISRGGPSFKMLLDDFNTQYMRNPDMVYVLKMEYVYKINIFGLNMMLKSGLEKIFLKFLHARAIFLVSHFTSYKGGFLHKITNSLTKMTNFVHGGISKKNLCGVW